MSARAWSAEGSYLALDTSTSQGSVCVGVGSRVVAGRAIRGQGSHSSDLIPTIGGLLREAGVDLCELDGLVVGAGPGSFTGVRVAAATAKGLAHALDIPLWAVSSLEAGAAAVDIDEAEPSVDIEEESHPHGWYERVLSEEERSWPRYVLFDARSDRVYGACYRPTGSGLEMLIPPHSTTIGAVLSEGLPFSVFAGDGAQRHADEIRGAGFTLLPAPLGMPTAAGLLRVVADSPPPGAGGGRRPLATRLSSLHFGGTLRGVGRMSSGLVLRPMKPSDVSEVARIETTAFSTPWSERTFRSLLHRSGVELWVAELGDQLAAYAILWRVLDEGELANLAVRTDLRGRGIGSGLLGRILEVAEDSGVRSLYLEVRESNGLAREMYARRGFHEIGVRKGYYDGPREDARVLKKSLEGA